MLIPKDNPTLNRIFHIIYRSDTPSGKLFDVVLLILILLSTTVLMLESIASLGARYGTLFFSVEVLITILFTLEYMLRVACLKNPIRYIFSFYGNIDFLSIVPFYLSFFLPSLYYVMVLRMLRILRVFRVLNLADYMNDGTYIIRSLRLSSRKIYIFVLFIVIFITIMGSLMYVVENGQNGFHSIPQSIYWAVVTITTVGYGDVSPVTPIGKFISVIIMLSGYAIIAVPTGIVTSEMKHLKRAHKRCERCHTQQNAEANYCQMCGEKFEDRAK